MNYSSEQLPNGRWGIYGQGKLLATIGCSQSCQEILRRLEFGQSNNSNKTQALPPSLQPGTNKLREILDSNVSTNQTAA